MPRGFGFVNPNTIKNDPLVSQHIKVPQSVIDIVTVRAEKEARHKGWIYRDWLIEAANAYVEKLKEEQAATRKRLTRKAS